MRHAGNSSFRFDWAPENSRRQGISGGGSYLDSLDESGLLMNTKQFFAAVTFSMFLGIGATSAADLRVKAAPLAAPVAAYSWTGCYVGAVGSYHWGRSNQNYGGLVNGVPNAFLPVGLDMSGAYNLDGAQIGGTVGCNYQSGNWVFGVEGDASWGSAHGGSRPTAAAIALGLNPAFEFTTEQKWSATVRGRVGYAWDRWLVYATGGVAFGGFGLNNQNSNPALITARRNPSNVDATGWIVGLGTEYAFSPAWSLKAEWLYADYGTLHYGDETGLVNGCTAGCANADVKIRENMVRVGVNYKFNWTSPVVAKY